MPPLNPWKVTGYKPGQNVVCKIVAPEMGGYAVTIPKDNLPGFLPTDQKLKVGEEVLAQFVCVNGNRVLLQPKMSASSLNARDYKPGAQPAISWEQQLNDPAAQQQIPGNPATAPTSASSASEAAFNVWAQNDKPKFRLRRAIDLILPAVNGEMPSKFKIGDADLEWLLTDLEGGMRTGCVKAFSEEKKSRAAVLLYRGRAVGCIYGCKTMTEPQPTEPSLSMMLADMKLPNTEVLIYDLPEEVTLAMSALFLGYPVERKDTLDARSYLDYIVDWLHGKQLTACLAFSLPSIMGTCLGFIHQGNFVGSFYVEEQKFSRDISFVHELISQDNATKVEASILPPEMTSSSVRFGFSLSMAVPRG
ncbi:MAG: hypothetical protein U0105_23870 [Candidatus Obscuribacterales bacterium]